MERKNPQTNKVTFLTAVLSAIWIIKLCNMNLEHVRKFYHYGMHHHRGCEVVERLHRAQVHIRGYGSVHSGVKVFEARKRRKVYLISFDMVIKIKVFKFECTTEHSNISSYRYSFLTS